ncbi:MAG: DHA2 family efflux MFS transporter permease subunit [Candidatus Eremiobacteraeota bacterium]|nr:DHA2 family efflux MFS transporter permease subunit [Candidatus Eremiobacteraeota bacterium]
MDLKESNVIEYGWRRVAVTFAVVAATLLEIIDTTIVNVALPNIQGNFGVAVDQGAWIVTGYIIANVIVIPLTPWLQQRFGRRAYYLASIGIFTVASLMCGLAGSFETLVFWRIIQGIGGGGLLSTSQSILRETYPLSEQGTASGIFAMGVIVGPTAGPLIGGIITDQLSWRWAFFVNLPVGIVAALLVWLVLRNPAAPQRKRLDWVGLGLLATGLGAMQFVLDQGQTKDWFSDAGIRLGTALCAAGLAGFILWTLRSSIPIVDLRVLKYRAVAAGCVLGGVLGVSLYGSIVVLPQYVQDSLSFTATASGELILTRALAIAALTPLVAIIASRNLVDARVLVGSGFAIVGISNWMLSSVTTMDSGFWTFTASLIVGGVGLSMVFVPLSMAVLGAVPASEVPKAAAFFNLSRQVGGSIATALLVTLFSRGLASHQTVLSGGMALHDNPIWNYLQVHGGQFSSSALQQLYSLLVDQATVLSYADTSRAVAILSILLAPLVFLMRRPRGTTSPLVSE